MKKSPQSKSVEDLNLEILDHCDKLDQCVKLFKEYHIARVIEETRDFNLFDDLIEWLHVIASKQNVQFHHRIISIAADVLEKIALEGYKPPRPSARKRWDVRRKVVIQWGLKKRSMTVQEFASHMHEEHNIPEGTVLKNIYRKAKSPRRNKNSSKKVISL